MASSFSDLLRLEQMVQGEQDNTWGDKTTDNLDKLEEAIAGRKSIALAASDVTLSTNNGGNGTSEQAAAMILDCSGVLSANVNIIAPNSSKMYIVKNGTTGAFTVGIKTTAGAALDIPQGETLIVWCDGTNVFETVNALISGTVALATNSLQLGGTVAANYGRLAIKNTWTNPQIVAMESIVLTANAFTPDADTQTVMRLPQSEVTAAFTINNPTGTPVGGQIMTFWIEQHDTTPRSITWGSEFVFTNDVNINLTQTVDAVDEFTFQWHGGLARWMAAGVAQNFPRS